jgi:hypothetical protein
MTTQRRVLILTTTFYPDPSVGGVRMTQWARCLPEFGWRPMVLTRYYGHAATPELLAEKVHPDVRLEYFNPPAAGEARGPSVAAAGGLKARVKRLIGSTAISGVFVPDVGVAQWRAVRSRVMEAVKDFAPDVVVTTGPPHSNHDIGLWLHRQTGIPWVADFRDPYLLDERFRPRLPFQFMLPSHWKFDRAVHEEASLVTHAIPVAARFWRLRLGPGKHRERIKVFTNACAPELAAGKVEPDVTPGGRRSIRVIGLIGPQEALHLACAVTDLVHEGFDLELRLIGHEPATLKQIEHLLGDRVRCIKGVRHDLALRQVAGADVLVNYLSPERAGHYLLSSKLFEYLATGSPVIEVNPTSPDRRLLKELPDVAVLKSPTLDELKQALRRALEMERGAPSPARRAFLQEHEWRTKVKTLAGWLEEIAPRKQTEAG